MEQKIEITSLLRRRQTLADELERLVYGSIEVREKDTKRYLYVHYREDGIPRTRYVGEFSESLENMIIANNLRAKELKRQIREIDKRLEELGYADKKIPAKVQRNIDFARRHIAETIYDQAVLEGVATTFAQTKNILEGGKANGLTSEEVLKIVNLKHAWEYVLNPLVILDKTDYRLMCDINRLIEEGLYFTAGRLRDVPVRIGGTDWQPELPLESLVREGLEEVLVAGGDEVEKAVRLMLFVMRRQVFIDGNKRTGVVLANHYLIGRGLGMIVIPAEKAVEFKRLLIPYYEGKDRGEMMKFVRKECHLKME